MQCQICNNNEATIHLTEIVDGSRSEMHICEQCATEQGVTVKSQMPINELLSNLLASAPSDEDVAVRSSKNVSCPHCGFTLDKFRKGALLGCPHDYEFFDQELLPLIEKAHNGQTQHCGKVPSKIPSDTKKEIKVLNLQQQLEQAVQAENYEEAAKLRDRINKEK
ncbi:UvrB/UvrC motif-containing protein [Planctomycetota bacterium]